MWVRTQNEDALYHVAAVRAVKMISERTYSVIGILLGAVHQNRLFWANTTTLQLQRKK